MKKLIGIILLTCSFTALTYAESSRSTYLELQALSGYPMTGLGWRMKKEQHGVDFSASVCPIAPVIFHAKSQYLFYPWATKGFYTGIGLGIVNEPESLQRITVSLEPSLGYSWDAGQRAHLFVEANGIVPFVKPGKVPPVWPGLSFGVGF